MISRGQTVFLALVLVFAANDATTKMAIHKKKCEKITIPFCQGLGYNLTIFPNNLEHETQKEAKVDAKEFTSLVDTQCSRDIVYFLCSLYAPVCTMLGKALPPCRSLCKSARSGCEELMNTYGFTWPQRFSCDRFPKVGLCVGRNSSSTSSRKNARRSGKRIDPKKLRRKRCLTNSGQGKYCCKLGRRAGKRGFNCNLRKKNNIQTRKSIKFRKTVIRKCSKYSSCFRSCCLIQQRRVGSTQNS